MSAIVQGAVERKRSSKLPRASELGSGRGGRGGERTGRSGISNALYEKGKATRADEVRLEMLEMTGEVRGSQVDMIVCIHEGLIPKEWRMGLHDSSDMEEERRYA